MLNGVFTPREESVMISVFPNVTLLQAGVRLHQFTSVQFSHSVMSDSLWPHESQHARPPCPSQTPRVYSNSCPLSGWCHPTISSSVFPFSSCPQSFPASGSFPVGWFFESGSQSLAISPSASVLPANIQDWFPLGLTGWITSHFSNSVFRISLRSLFVHLLAYVLLSISMSTIFHPGNSDLSLWYPGTAVSVFFYIYPLQALLTVELKCSFTLPLVTLYDPSEKNPTFNVISSLWGAVFCFLPS